MLTFIIATHDMCGDLCTGGTNLLHIVQTHGLGKIKVTSRKDFYPKMDKWHIFRAGLA